MVGKILSYLKVRPAEYCAYWYLARHQKRLHTPVVGTLVQFKFLGIWSLPTVVGYSSILFFLFILGFG